eukprot:717612-Pelagomonas_calceolata.AAC.2
MAPASSYVPVAAAVAAVPAPVAAAPAAVPAPAAAVPAAAAAAAAQGRGLERLRCVFVPCE